MSSLVAFANPGNMLPSSTHPVPTLVSSPSSVTYIQSPGQFVGQPQLGQRSYAPEAAAAVAVTMCIVGAGLTNKHRKQHRRGRQSNRRIVRCAAATPYPALEYNHVTASAYFSKKPVDVLQRAWQLTSFATSFGTKLINDKATGQWEQNEDMRAAELVDVISTLGPTFIKIGQALSIRSDLMPPSYLKALAQLQDKVHPFPSDQAYKIIEEQLGGKINSIFSEITPTPIAAASLGQVYKARLKGEGSPEVAIKVQRPGMLEVIGLDLYLLRLGAAPLKQFIEFFAPIRADFVALVDNWGEGFVAELNYVAEAKNAEHFSKAVLETALSGAVCAPRVLNHLTNSMVLTTEWVNGERLELSTGPDVTKLCSLAMNSYLTMLLQFGVLHADPHPGNLMRADDGRLVILDWGLVTSVDQNIQLALIEHVAHLVSGDYDKVPRDLVALGFIMEGSEDAFDQPHIVEELMNIYKPWITGGGSSVSDFMGGMQRLGMKYGFFQLPSYFFYIARAFAVLEGIGLSNSPTYSVVTECLPYISRRLLTDSSPRMGGALQTYVYGDEAQKADRVLDVKKLEYLAEGFSSFSSSSGGLVMKSSGPEDAGRLVEQLADVLIGKGENDQLTPLQDIVLEELSKAAGAGTRHAFEGYMNKTPANGVDGEEKKSNVTGVFSFLYPNESDRRALQAVSRVAAIGGGSGGDLLGSFRALSREEQAKTATQVLSKLWDYRGGVGDLGQRLLKKVGMNFMSRALSDVQNHLKTAA